MAQYDGNLLIFICKCHVGVFKRHFWASKCSLVILSGVSVRRSVLLVRRSAILVRRSVLGVVKGWAGILMGTWC